MSEKRALMVATVCQSLVFQAPTVNSVLTNLGYKVSFVAAEDRWAPRLREQGDVYRLELRRSLNPLRVIQSRGQLRGLMQSGDWDLLQTQSPIASLVIRTIPGIRRLPSIYVAHGFHFHREGSRLGNALFGSLESALAGRTTALAVVSSEDFDEARRRGFHKRTLLWRLPGAGVDLTRFQKKSFWSGDRPRTAIFVGELNENKDPLLAVAAVLEARRMTSRDIRLHLIGDGPLRDEIKKLEHAHSWIRWDEFVEPSDLAILLQESRVLIAPSRREGLPRVIIEALASGTPVIARSNRGSRELLGPVAGGQLLGSTDPDDWAHSVLAHIDVDCISQSDVESVKRYSMESFNTSYRKLVARLEAAGGRRLRGAVDLADQ